MRDWKKIIEKIGWPRMIIGLFLFSTYCIAPFVGIPLFVAFRDTFTRFGMNAILVLSLMPMIEAGAGLNFGMPLGIEAGLLGALISIQLGLEGGLGFFAAILLALPFAILFGWVYGFILNRVKGGRNDDCHLYRILYGIFHVYDVSVTSFYQGGYDLGLRWGRTENDNQCGTILAKDFR